MQVLIVDDSEISLALLESTLTEAGHRVDTARDGYEALEALRERSYRIVISDWDMPNMDGLTLCRRVRANSSHYVYFILLTAHNTSSDIVTGLAAGADDFVRILL